ncbi:ubiquitin carboxyl-terminal hydrolase 32-like isoform X1 [Amphiura filiformis]
MACGLSACCRGPQAERQKFCFKIFDADHDGLLNRTELETMVKALINVRRENRIGSEIDFKAVENLNPASIATDILSHHDGDNDGAITAEEFQVWAVKNSLPDDFYKLLFQICHIILGLRPANKEEERDIIMGWVDRDKRRGLRLTQTWYLISMPWWRQWNNYVNSKFNTGVQKASSFSSPSHSSSRSSNQAWSDVKPRSPLSLRRNHISNSAETLPRTANNNLGSPRSSPKRLQGSSSSMVGPTVPSKPGPIDNTPLIMPDARKVNTLTNEGGRLKRHPALVRTRDYDILPDPVWKALAQWYAGGPALPRNVIVPSQGDPTPQLELYPISVKLLRHQTNQQRQNTWNGVNIGSVSISSGGISFGQSNNTTNNTPAAPKRYLAYTSSFSKMHTLQQVYEFLSARLRIRTEEMRLWNLRDENNPVLLEDDSITMEQAGIVEDQSILIEVRNKDLSWPEEMSLLAKIKQDKQRQIRTECGVTGLSNLGNTCFMNAAVQCISNTQPLTLYFKMDSYLFELNPTNPLGMKGHIAKRYGELIKDLWAGNAKSIAPLKLRWTIAKYASQFNGFQQQDSQELLAFLLDGLHEDLNRVQEKPYTELKDSDGRPDHIVATEAWDNHLLRNQSIIVDLFHGQLKSQVRCKTCGHVSVKFDPFTFLSLPLPMESSMHLEIVVVRLDGTVPIKYGLRLNMDDKYKVFKKQLGDLCGLTPEQLLLVEVGGAMVRSFPSDAQKIRTLLGGMLYAYEIPTPTIHLASVESLTHSSKSAQTQINCNQENTPNIQPLPPVDCGSESNSSINHPNGGINHTTNNNPVSPKNEPPQGDGNTNRPNGDIPSVAASKAMRPNGDIPGRGSPMKTHSRNPSTTSSASSVGPIQPGSHSFDGFVVAMHRKMIRMDMYFLSWQKSRPCLFGIPLILPCTPTTAHEELYKAVWMQVARLVSSPAPGESTTIKKNHAEDGDSPRHSYPFVLKAVQKDGLMCAWCPWYRFCRGCEIACNKETFGSGTAFLAIDWDPTALHLRYQSSQERVVTEHESVEKSRRLQTEPINLDDCLRAFTKEEELGEEDFYYCSKCKQHRLAAKKLDIWRLPPILIVHMKRFQFVNGRWVKSQKIVKFPKHNFDPSNFLAPRVTCNIVSPAGIQTPLKKDTETQTSEADSLGPKSGINISTIKVVDDSQTEQQGSPSSQKCNEDAGASDEVDMDVDDDNSGTKLAAQSEITDTVKEVSEIEDENQRTEEMVTSSVSRPSALPEPLNIKTDFDEGDDGSFVEGAEGGRAHPPLIRSKSQLSPPVDATDAHPLLMCGDEDDQRPLYNLYAVVCHTGILGGGHYVAYGVNPNNKWYCYNDSSVKELKDEIDTDNAYMLFYERTSLNYASFVPDTQGKVADTASIDDEIEADYKKFCVIQ